MVASISALFQVGDLGTFISAIRILYKDFLSIPPSRHCPRGYPSAVIGRPTRNVFSRTVLYLVSSFTSVDPIALIFGVGVGSQVSPLPLPSEFPLGVKA
jgi:hypothetical protein